MATEIELMLENTLKTLLEQQENERNILLKKLEILEQEYLQIQSENSLIQKQYNEISSQLTSLINSLTRLNKL